MLRDMKVLQKIFPDKPNNMSIKTEKPHRNDVAFLFFIIFYIID